MKRKISIFGIVVLAAGLTFTSCSKEENILDQEPVRKTQSTYSDDVKCTVTSDVPGGTATEKGTRCYFANSQNCSFQTNCNTTGDFINLVNQHYTDEEWDYDLANGVPYTEPAIIDYIENNFRGDSLL